MSPWALAACNDFCNIFSSLTRAASLLRPLLTMDLSSNFSLTTAGRENEATSSKAASIDPRVEGQINIDLSASNSHMDESQEPEKVGSEVNIDIEQRCVEASQNFRSALEAVEHSNLLPQYPRPIFSFASKASYLSLAKTVDSNDS